MAPSAASTSSAAAAASPSAPASSSSLPFSPPSSLLIIGAGVFGLSTALALARRDAFARCSITVVDRSNPSQPGAFPSPDAASVDSSRIIRADYADPAYTALGEEAQAEWRKQDKPTDLGAQGRYHKAGLILVGDREPPAPPPGDAQTSQSEGLKPKMTGLDYARASWANVSALAAKNPQLAARIEELPNPDAIRGALGTGGGSGEWGYINRNSGWVNATACMAWLLDRVRETGRVNLVADTVVSLERDGATITGAKLSSGRVLTADLVIVAAGAWTGGLVDLAGQVIATGQILGYMDLTESEQSQLANIPVILNLSTGLFIIPPTDRVLKIGRHARGYINPTPLPYPPLPSSPSSSAPQTVSLPRTTLTHPPSSPSSPTIPAEGTTSLRVALQAMIPWPALHARPFSRTRLCWYSDTPTADFLVDYHPRWRGLFIATGDSGHAFKFLPVLGEKIVDCLVREGSGEMRGKWAWRDGGEGKEVVTEDGTRGGQAGWVLEEELASG
ncbi:FAD dependent oxidoreductase [Staphylotrichum tortipilum]|uniref:FAD dependent oxidoreductase n=1 Tax=Staphylotrichum tortipilum TaxID=2831512 RepID=A0AAN6MNW1_9PEZI|nr:FAD dependent oxidoreductase [Staphylotrichum longicolle]